MPLGGKEGEGTANNYRVIFVRIGWMKNYQGPSTDDPRPRAGGDWNREHIGAEVVNFQPFDGKYYGYFEPPGGDGVVDFSRIEPALSTGDELPHTMIIWVARKPDGGQVVVGWYRDATILRTPIKYSSKARRDDWGYNCYCEAPNAQLLPVTERTWTVPRGRNSIGQRNIFYPLDGEGNLRLNDSRFRWVREILAKVDAYDGTHSRGPAIATETTSAAAGQGFVVDSDLRRAIEGHAMMVATAHFEGAGYRVDDHHARHSYDLLITRNGHRRYVEVKGTRTDGETVIVTPSEVRFARENDTVLFILRGVGVDGSDRVSGGTALIVDPWTPSDNRLTPTGYLYRVSGP
ncbi:MAG: DUF3883 domain-containing protein [Candidatus Marsarchaeota archaeon]|nr:DUF3883 domain-containing protein [Candidatus Marsarchaeota archaeon]